MLKAFILIFFAQILHAQGTLELVKDPSDPQLTFTGDPSIRCDQILARLATYSQKVRQHEANLTDFLNDVADKATRWYTRLGPLEGTTQTLPAGTFTPLQDGADKIQRITGMAIANTDLIAQELDLITQSLTACLPQQK